MKRLISLLVCLSGTMGALVFGQENEAAPGIPAPTETQRGKQTDAPAPAPKAEALEPLGIKVSLGHTRTRDIYDAVTIFVELENRSKEALTVTYLYLRCDDEFTRTRRQITPKLQDKPDRISFDAVNRPSDGTWLGREDISPITISAGRKIQATLEIPNAGGRDLNDIQFHTYLKDVVTNPYLLTFAPQNFEFRVFAEYKITEKEQGSASGAVSMDFNAAWVAVMLGGALGCVMVSVLMAGSRIVANSRQYNLGTWKFTDHLLTPFAEEGVWLFLGIPAVIVTIVLFLRLDAAAFPITFKVSDATGGLLLGLFSRTIVKPLMEKLFPSDVPKGDNQQPKGRERISSIQDFSALTTTKEEGKQEE